MKSVDEVREPPSEAGALLLAQPTPAGELQRGGGVHVAQLQLQRPRTRRVDRELSPVADGDGVQAAGQRSELLEEAGAVDRDRVTGCKDG
ncbi:MAG: hypothetical protein ACT4QF_24445 [Sporichthyaceae bacterium]